MPILEQGYQPYRGGRTSGALGFLHIGWTALKRNRRWYVWLLLIASVVFGSSVEYALVFFVYAAKALVGSAPQEAETFFKYIVNHPRFYPDMMATQTFWAIVMASVVGAGEIAEDIRTGGLVFYLGRPVTRTGYLLGKVFALAVPVLLVTFVPTALLFTIQALSEANWQWFRDNWRVLPAAFAYSAVLVVFVSGFVLGISSIARRRRWATVSIAAVLIGMWVVSGAIAPPLDWTAESEERRARKQIREAASDEDRDAALQRLADASDRLGSGSERPEWRALSPTATLAAVGRDLFGQPIPSNFPGRRHWFLVFGASAALLFVVWRRVRAVEVVS